MHNYPSFITYVHDLRFPFYSSILEHESYCDYSLYRQASFKESQTHDKSSILVHY